MSPPDSSPHPPNQDNEVIDPVLVEDSVENPPNQDNDDAPAPAVVDPVLVEDSVEKPTSSLQGDNEEEEEEPKRKSRKSSVMFSLPVLDHSSLSLNLPDDASNPVDTTDVETEDAESEEQVPVFILSGVVGFSALYTTLFSGAIFGWGPMQLMLEKDGAFETQCGSDEELPCDQQSVTLVQIQLVATIMAVCSPFLGMFTDHFGALALMYMLAFFGASGIILTMLASISEAHALYYISFALTGLMFVATTQMIVQTGIVMPGKNCGRVISVLNALLDTGSVVYLGLYEIAKATGANLVQIMGGYLGLAVFCFSGAIGFWTMLIRFTERSMEREEESFESGNGDPEKTKVDALGASATEPTEYEDMDSSHKNDDAVAKIAEWKKAQLDASDHRKNHEDEQEPEYIMIAQRPPSKQLVSKQYVLLLIFFSIHLTRNNWVMASGRDFLASLGDDEYGNKYTQLFVGLSASSLLGLPFLDILMNKYGFHATFQAINLLGVIHGVIQVSTDNLNVQVLGFVVFSFYRCFTFSATFSFVPTFLSGNTVGRGCGGLSFVSAIFSLVNMGLIKWTIDGLNRDFFVPNLLFLLVILPIFYVTWMTGECIKKEKDAEEFVSPIDLGKSRRASLALSRSCRILFEPDAELTEPEFSSFGTSKSFRVGNSNTNKSFRVVNSPGNLNRSKSFRVINSPGRSSVNPSVLSSDISV